MRGLRKPLLQLSASNRTTTPAKVIMSHLGTYLLRLVIFSVGLGHVIDSFTSHFGNPRQVLQHRRKDLKDNDLRLVEGHQ